MGFCVWLNVKIFWFYNQMKRAIAFTNWGLKKKQLESCHEMMSGFQNE